MAALADIAPERTLVLREKEIARDAPMPPALAAFLASLALPAAA
jgi:hypothetical protein